MGVTKKFTWEVDKTSLILRVTDGAKETTWKLRKNMSLGDISQTVEDIWLALQDTKTVAQLAEQLMPRMEELSDEHQEWVYEPVQADSEEASRAAQAARVQQLNASAKWFAVDEDETYDFSIPDYDSGEI